MVTQDLRPRRTEAVEEGEFILFDQVPVFDAHEGEDGTVYDQRLLEAIAENCNRRIRDTGDWCPVVLAHTKDPEEKTGTNDDPPVLGFAGPFWVDRFGNEKKRPAIYAKFWIFPEEEQRFRRNPRRSVEIWPEERPEDRYFDPIAVLGSETPKRDLGMIYSKGRRGQKPNRYEMAAPSGSNTFIPGGDDDKIRNSKGDDMQLDDATISQIFEALKPQIEAIVSAKLPAVEDGEPAMADVQEEMADLPGDDPGMPPGAPPMGDPGMPPGAPPMGDPGMPPGAPPMGDPGMPPGAPPMDDPGMPPGADADLGLAPPDDEDGDDEDDDADPNMKNADEKPISYMEPDAETKAKYCEGCQKNAALPQKYSRLNREHGDLRIKYQAAVKRLQILEKAERYSRRRSDLLALAEQGYPITVEDELAATDSFTDQQWKYHCETRIPQCYHKFASKLHDFGIERPRNLTESVSPEQYGKKARELTLKFRKEGKQIAYKEVLNNLKANKGEYIEK